MFRLTIFIALCLLLPSIDAAPVVKSLTGCSVEACDLSVNGFGGNQSCSQAIPCYKFYTTRNTTICAPPINCSMFEPCINNSRTCTSSLSVCVSSSCCDRAVCVPLALTQVCTAYTSSSSSSWSQRLCQNATWDSNGVSFVGSYYNGYYISTTDFVVDGRNNVLILDGSNRQILQVNANNNSNFTVLAYVGNGQSTYANYMALDSNGSALLTESFYSMSSMGYLYQISKYRLDGSNNSGVIVYGPFPCGTGLSELCSSSGFTVDSSGSIYYSDNSYHRVLKIQQFATSATIVAGISGSSGSALNQLSSPGALAVDSSGNLYVSDFGNYRVLKFTPGSTTGVLLFSTSLYQGVSSMIIDSSGSIIVSSSSNILRWFPQLNGYVTIMRISSYSTYRIRLDNSGNILALQSSGGYIYRHNLLMNYC